MTDANGCFTVATIDIQAKEAPKEEDLIVNANQSGENKCAGDRNGAISISVEGGIKPYQYTWSKEGLNGPKVAGLGADTYSLSVTDALGTVVEKQISISGPPAMKLNAYEMQPASRDGSRDGRAVVKASGGTAPYTYIWDNGEDRSKAIKLKAGSRTVTVLDNNNCKLTANVEVTVRQIPELDVTALSSGQIIRLEKLYFDADSSRIKPESLPMLNELSRFLRANPNISIEVGGHTNSIPEASYCDRLSTARAKSVVDYLQTNGVASNRLQFKGYGKRKPVATNKTVAGRKRNQRVELKILSVGNG